MAKNNSHGQILLEMMMVMGLFVILLTTIFAQDFKRQKKNYERLQVYEANK